MPMLLVVDMQAKRFKTASHDWLLRNVRREIRAAKSAGWGIVFLEYTRGVGCGGVRLGDRTHYSLTRIVADYEHAMTVHKEHDDGNAEVRHAAKHWRGEAGERHIDGGIRVVGVNTEACVAGTVNGLAEGRGWTMAMSGARALRWVRWGSTLIGKVLVSVVQPHVAQ